MTLDDLGNIGEFVGAVGVVVSLIYLAAQIRRNTSSVRASTFQEAVRDIATLSDLLATDAELSRIWSSGLQDLDALKPDERVRFAAYMLGMFRRLENVVYQTQHGALDPAYWEGQLSSLRGTLSQPGVAAWWARAQGLFSPDFREYVERELTSGKGHAAEHDGRRRPAS